MVPCQTKEDCFLCGMKSCRNCSNLKNRPSRQEFEMRRCRHCKTINRDIDDKCNYCGQTLEYG